MACLSGAIFSRFSSVFVVPPFLPVVFVLLLFASLNGKFGLLVHIRRNFLSEPFGFGKLLQISVSKLNGVAGNKVKVFGALSLDVVDPIRFGRFPTQSLSVFQSKGLRYLQQSSSGCIGQFANDSGMKVMQGYVLGACCGRGIHVGRVQVLKVGLTQLVHSMEELKVGRCRLRDLYMTTTSILVHLKGNRHASTLLFVAADALSASNLG